MKQFVTLFWRITSSHIITYFLAGIFAYYFLNYQVLFETPPFSNFMKPMNSLAVSSRTCITIRSGIYFSIALWSFRDIFLNTKYGWLKLWGLLLDYPYFQQQQLRLVRLKDLFIQQFLLKNRLLGTWKSCRKPCCFHSWFTIGIKNL